MRFDIGVDPGGYAWWYLDGISDDGAHGLTLIAFIGSVFSPYYAFSGRKDPINHCAINLALYGGSTARWAMTERSKRFVDQSEGHFKVGPSQIVRTSDGLAIEVNERGAPLPRPLRGRIRVHFEALNTHVFTLDAAQRHHWRPVAPVARIEVAMEEPALSWKGRAYVDSNWGSEGLEDGFKYWDWARAELSGDRTLIVYNTQDWRGDERERVFMFDQNADFDEHERLVRHAIGHTPIWRIPQHTTADLGADPRTLMGFEDTPFYSRSMIETTLHGERVRAVHEAFSGKRLSSPFIKALLPVRMPRVA